MVTTISETHLLEALSHKKRLLMLHGQQNSYQITANGLMA